MKKILLTLGVTFALLFTGCGEDNLGSAEEGEKRLEIQSLIDAGDYETVISLLEQEDGSYQSIYPDDEYKLYLASAYLSKSGFTLDVVLDLMPEDEEDNATSSESSSASDLLTTLADKIKLADAIKASTLFKEATDVDCTNSDQLYIDTLSNGEKEICLFVGITGMMKTAVTLSYLTEDLASFFETSDEVNLDGTPVDDGVPPSMLATACALEYALSTSPQEEANITTDTFYCSNDANLTIDGNVKFDNNPDYEHVTIKVDSNYTNSQLINYTTFLRSSILIKDACSASYVACDTIDYSAGCYVCPVAKTVEEAEAIPPTTEILLETINEDIEALVNMIPADLLESEDSNDSNTTDVVAEFKQEITGGEDRDITEADLLNYFNGESEDDNTTGDYCILVDEVDPTIQTLGTVDSVGDCIAQ